MERHNGNASCAAIEGTTMATGTTSTRSRVALRSLSPPVAPFLGLVLGRLVVGEFKASWLDENCDASRERLDRTAEGPPFDRRAACSRGRAGELPCVQARVAVLHRFFREIVIFDKSRERSDRVAPRCFPSNTTGRRGLSARFELDR